MPFIEAKELTFQYESHPKPILKEVSFSVGSHSRIGLIGNNGSGKSTLLQILIGNLRHEQGVYFKKGGLKIGYLPQKLVSDQHVSCMDFLFQAKPQLAQIRVELRRHQKSELAYINWLMLFDEHRGFQFELEARKHMQIFGIPPQQLDQSILELSAGELTKLGLIRTLLSKPDLLLLDEPTNYLDQGALDWLSNFMTTIKIPFIVVSHDRHFIDLCCQEIWFLEKGRLEHHNGNYTFFKHQKELEYERKKLQFETQQKRIKRLQKAAAQKRNEANKMETFKLSRSIKKNGSVCKRDDGSGSSGRLKIGKSMRTAVAMEKKISLTIQKEEAQKPFLEKKKKIHLCTNLLPRNRVAMRVEKLTKSYQTTIFKDLTFHLIPGEKIAITGPNGSGKSSLLRILASQDKDFGGELHFSPRLTREYFSVERPETSPRATIAEELQRFDPKRRQAAYNLLGGMGTSSRLHQTPITKLSAGERAKLSLVRIITAQSNFLILDEPTNHLEIGAVEALTEALKSFSGTLIIASHDKRLVSDVCDRIIDMGSFSIPSPHGLDLSVSTGG